MVRNCVCLTSKYLPKPNNQILNKYTRTRNSQTISLMCVLNPEYGNVFRIRVTLTLRKEKIKLTAVWRSYINNCLLKSLFKFWTNKMHEAILQILSNYMTNALLWYAWTKKVNLVDLLESIAQITAIFFICFQFQGSLSTLDMVTLQDCWLPEGCSEAAKSLERTLRMKTQTQRSTRRQNPSQYQLLNSQVLVCLFFCISILF